MDFSWMAWTLPTALFFATMIAFLLGMAVWEYVSPGGAPRMAQASHSLAEQRQSIARCV